MNRKIFENYMHTEPDTLDKKYMFIVDNIDLALSIIDAGFSVVVLQEDSETFFSPDGLMEYLNSIAFLGTCRMDYMYVPACSTKKANDTLAEFFREEALDYREGWMLFKDKNYLQKLSHRTEMQKLLHAFIERYEKPPESEPDLDRFHILDKNGNPTNAFDIAIVEEILKTVPFFVLRGIPMVEKLRRASDSVQAFLDETICRREGSRIPRSRMFFMYDDYCSDNGRQALGKAKFLMTMEQKGYTVTKYQGIISYRGVAVQENDFEELGEDDETPFDTA